MVARCAELGVDVAFVANQFSVQRSGCATTVIGTGKSRHLQSAVEAVGAPIDEDLITDLLALRPPVAHRTWISGLPQNNTFSCAKGEHTAGRFVITRLCVVGEPPSSLGRQDVAARRDPALGLGFR
jgi:hypothetical protein